MKHGPTHITAFLILLLACCTASAQVTVKASVDRSRILIGERILLNVEAYMPSGEEVGWFNADTIPHFEVLSNTTADTTQNADGKKISQLITLTSFDSGRWQIPAFAVTVGGKPYYSDSISVDVAFVSFDPKEDYRDIKDIIVVSSPSLEYIPWVIGAVALVSLILIIWLLRKRKPLAVVEKRTAVVYISPLEEALKALIILKSNGVKEGAEKVFYSEMNDILRRYVSAKFGISTFERTNEELILRLSGMAIAREDFIRLTQSLRMSDFVKFAKYHPSEEDNISNLDIVRTSIESLDNNYIGAV